MVVYLTMDVYNSILEATPSPTSPAIQQAGCASGVEVGVGRAEGCFSNFLAGLVRYLLNVRNGFGRKYGREYV